MGLEPSLGTSDPQSLTSLYHVWEATTKLVLDKLMELSILMALQTETSQHRIAGAGLQRTSTWKEMALCLRCCAFLSRTDGSNPDDAT